MSDAALFGDTDDAALFGDPPKSKYPGPKPVTDEDVGLSSGTFGAETPLAGSGFGQDRPPLSPTEQALKSPIEGDVAFAKEAAPYALGGLLGKGAGAAIGKLATKPAAAAADEAAAAVQAAIENSFAGKLGKLLAPEATKATTGFVTKTAPAAIKGGISTGAAATAAVAPTAGAAAGSALSNAVERLRANAAISPSAMDFTRRMEASKNTPLNTVSTGTLGEAK